MEDNRRLSSIIIDALRAKGVTIDRLSAMTGVSERFLSSLVNDEFENLPAVPYVHGYLIKIAETLGLDGKKLWQEYLKHNAVIRRSGKNDQLPKNRFVTPTINKKIIFVILIVILVLGYLLIRLPAFTQKPELVIEKPAEETVYVASSSFTVRGKSNPNNRLTLNGEQIYPDKDGLFEKEIELQQGFNTLRLSAKKFLGRETTVTKQIFYEVGGAQVPKEPEAQSQNESQ